MSKFRISSLYVDLVQYLGIILRDFKKIEVIKTECWTFTFTGNSASYANRHPVTYYGKGSFKAKIPEEYRDGNQDDTICDLFPERGFEGEVQVAVMCDLFQQGDFDEWIFYIWLRWPNGATSYSSAQKRPGCELDHGWSRTSAEPPFRVGTLTPPEEIRFN